MKECKHCGTRFQPMRPLQQVCSPICASRLVKAAKKEEREHDKARADKLKRIPDLIREAQAVFNKWVRARDAEQPCISCGKFPGDMKALHAGRDAGHFRSVGSASHLRFSEWNVNAQCVHCNQWLAGNVLAYRAGLIERLGRMAVTALETNNVPHKWSREELMAIKATYKAKLKELEKQ